MVLVGLNIDGAIIGFYPVDIHYNEADLPRINIKITSELHWQLLGGSFKFINGGNDKEIYDIEDIGLFHPIPQQVVDVPRSKAEIDLERVLQENIQLKERLELVECAMNDLLLF